MDKIFGIDLGTTNSEIAYLKDGKPEVITVENGEKYIPSVVGIDPSGRIITGFAARNQYAAFPENTVVSIKRKMGSGQKVSMAGKMYTPARISSEIIKTLRMAAEKETGLPVKKVVITVPAYFTDIQRKETIQAGELAGLEVVRIINEPTAAALVYGCRENQYEKILVYDLGGGTFDVSLIEVEDEIIEVLATDGDSLLGGDDFDRLLEDHFFSHLPKKAVSSKDLKAIARLKNVAERVKIRLSNESRLDVQEEFITSLHGKPVHLELSVSRKDFEELIEAELDKTFNILEKVMNTAGSTRSDIAKILLVGGSTYIPCIFNILKGRFGFKVHRKVDPTYCVAMGAAIQGAIIADEAVSTILVDVNSHSLGIRCLNIKPFGTIDHDHYSIIIHKNTPIPTSMSRTYYTLMKNQKAVDIEVYQGENPAATNNTPLGAMVMDKLPKNLPAGSEIEITFEYNLNGIVDISAFERQSGKREKFKVDINRQEAAREEDFPGGEEEKAGGQFEDGRQTEKEISRVKIKRLINTARKKLDKIENPEIYNEIESRINILEEAIEGDFTSGRILEKVERTSEDLAELIAVV